MRIVLPFILICYLVQSLSAQYNGGVGDGYLDIQINSDPLFIFDGDTADGYSIAVVNQDTLNIFFGDTTDGFASIQLGNSLVNYYLGGNQDGYSETTWLNTPISIFYGGGQDGFSSLDVFQRYIWTGAVGTGWLVDGNWQTNQPPTIRHDVIIPADAANWPNVNAGLFRIGRDSDGSADYLCRKITVDTGATLITRVNTFIENYGQMKIDGTYEIRNTSDGAFQNKTGGGVLVRGSVITD